MAHVHIHGCWPRTAPCVLKFLKEVFRMRNLKRALSLALASVMLLGMMVVGRLKRFKVNHIFSPLFRPKGLDIDIVT